MKNSGIILFFITACAFAQTSINNYQYVIIPSKFDFSRTKDEFHLNTLTKFLFEKYGFKALLDSEPQPEDIADSNFKKLYATVDSKGGFMSTKVRIIIKDCKNKVLYTSDEGSTREKDVAKAYNIAIRQAFESFPELHYKYNPSGLTQNNITPVKETAIMSGDFNNAEVLTAEPLGNGLQLVDSASKVVMKLFRTSSPDRFIVVKGETNGELLSKNGQWYFEYYQNDKLISERINVKF